MAYSSNGKVFTDHALMDEVVYHVKIILKDIVLKNESKANDAETEKSMEMSDYLIAIKNGSIKFSYFPFTIDLLLQFGYSSLQAETYVKDRNQIPEEDRAELLEFCCDKFVRGYVEYNNYYRTLNGQPEYGTVAYNVYVDPNDPKFNVEGLILDMDFRKPIHEFTQNQINTLESLGILDDIRAKYTGSKYQYLDHIGGKKIDIYTARIAANWDILYIPDVEFIVKTRFKELYTLNRDIYERRTYQQAYVFESDYYEEMIMIMILCQTFTDIITELPEWYIRRDVFDLRTVQYFLESQGIKFFKEIPLKYQIRIVKNMNKLIRYKSTNQNIHDILEIFSFEGTVVYKYYIYKKYLYTDKDLLNQKDSEEDKEWKMDPEYDFGYEDNFPDRLMDLTGATIYDFLDENESDFDPKLPIHNYEFGNEDASFAPSSEETKDKEEKQEASKIIVDENGNVFELEFVRVPIDESYDDYIKDNINRESYDNVVSSDRYWNGEDVHSYVENLHLEKDFSVEGTKFMFIDNTLSMQEYIYQMCYFLNMLFSSKIDTEDIEISIPTIQPNTLFSLIDICLLLYCLSAEFSEKSALTVFPNNTRLEEKPDFVSYHDIDGGDISTEGVEEIDGQGVNIQNDHRWNWDGGHIDYSIIDSHSYDEWMRTNNPHLFVPVSGRIYGFNLSVDLEKIKEDISVRHSAFGFQKGYTLEDFGIENFRTTDKISTLDELVEIYRDNTEIYKKVEELITEGVDTRDEIVTLNYIFNNLFTIPFDTEFYRLKDGTLAENFVDILSNKNYTLYSFYMGIMREKDPEVRKELIRQVLNDTVDTLEYYLGTDDLKYIFSFVPTTSPDAIIKYINLMINFFKSWKVHFLDPVVTYSLDDKKNDNVYGNGDMLTELKTSYGHFDTAGVRDSVRVKSVHVFEDFEASGMCEVIDMYGFHQTLVTEDEDYDGLYSNTVALYGRALPIDYTELEGGKVSDLEKKNAYIMVNAGIVSARKDAWDLDGGGPLEMQEYLTADGLHITSPGMSYPLLNDFSTPFYIIDGGTVGKSYVRTGTIATTVVKRQVNNDVIISTYDSNAVKDSDGLYLGGDFASGDKFRELKALLYEDREINETKLNEYIEDVRYAGNPDIIEQLVKSVFKNKFAISELLLEDYRENITVNYLKSYTNDRVTELRNWFIDLNLFGWQYF